MLMAPALVAVLAAAQAAPERPSATAQAERLAEEARALVARDPAGALARARRAVALTAEFVPTEFVRAGRKGEVVEDEFLAAREEYKRHVFTRLMALLSLNIGIFNP